MTISEVEKHLPNGFHDATIDRMNINYVTREAWFEMTIAVGVDKLNEFRKGKLTLAGLVFCSIPIPDPECLRENWSEPQIVDSGTVESHEVPVNFPPNFPKGVLGHYFYIENWNAYIVLAAREAKFDYVD